MPRAMSIHTHTMEFFNYSPPIFICGSVEEMSLSIQNGEDDDSIEPESINLPSLKKLKLDDMPINDNFLTMLFLGCPLLKEVEITECDLLHIGEISSDTIKKLSLNDCILFKPLSISCPGVLRLSMECREVGEEITLKNMSSLVNADFFFEDMEFDNLEFLGGLSNVTNLRLHLNNYDTLELLEKESLNCPFFNNLTSLTLGELDLNCHRDLVDSFLQHSPNLKKLTLHLYPPDEDEDEDEGEGEDEDGSGGDDDDKEDGDAGTSVKGFGRALSLQREYLETVVIVRCHGMSSKMAGELVSTLGTLIKKIGRVIIL